MNARLAIMGGSPAVTTDAQEQWRRPVEKEKAAVCRLIDEDYLSGSGEGLPRQFEEEFKAFIGCEYVLATSHGHTAIASAFFAAGLGAGDEFVHPTLGYLGCYAGASPPRSGLSTPSTSAAGYVTWMHCWTSASVMSWFS